MKGESRSPVALPFVVALGSNLGDRAAHLEEGLAFLHRRVGLEVVSRVVESEPWGPVEQGPFLNAVARGRMVGGAFELLEVAQAAERAAGRMREERYGPRTLDVDIVFFADLVIDSSLLRIPHPHWLDRPFVADLLPDVAGAMVDPRSGRSVDELVPGGELSPGLREVLPRRKLERAGAGPADAESQAPGAFS